MPSRRFVPVRQNRAMPESPKIVKKVMNYVMNSKDGARTTIFIPWDDFVFSNVELAPGSLVRKGLEIIKREGPPTDSARIAGRPDEYVFTKKGVNWEVRVLSWSDVQSRGYRGTVNPFWMTLESCKEEGTIRHELLHLTQIIGEHLMMLAKKNPYALTRHAFSKAHSDRMAANAKRKRGASKRKETKEQESIWTLQYGSTKKRSKTFGKGADMMGGSASHALHDIEFHTDAMNVGLAAAASPVYRTHGQPDEYNLLVNVFRHASPYIRNFTNRRKYDFYAAAYHRGAEEINEKGYWRTSRKLETSLGKAIASGVLGSVSEFRDLKGLYTKPPEPKKKGQQSRPSPRPAPAPTPAPRPGRQAAKKKVAGYSVRHEMLDGRMAYVIYDESQKRTGKYFFSQEKAQAHIAKVSRAG